MHSPLISTVRQSRPAIWLALVALLLVSGLQLTEAGHQHAASDTAEHCLLCKTDGTVALTSLPLDYAAATPRDYRGVPRVQLSNAGSLQHALARGPPATS